MLELNERTISPSRLSHLHVLLTQQDAAAANEIAQIDRQLPLRETVSYFQCWQALNSRQWKQVEEQMERLSHACAIEEGMLTLCNQQEQQAVWRFHLAEIAQQQNWPTDALHHLRACIALPQSRRVHLPALTILATLRLAELCQKLGMREAAIAHAERVLALCRRYHDERWKGEVLTLLCQLYLDQKAWIIARYYAEQALRAREEHPEYDHEALRLQLLLATIAEHEDRIPDAITHLRTASTLLSDQQSVATAVEVSARLALCHCKQDHQNLMEETQAQAKTLLPAEEHAEYSRAYLALGNLSMARALSSQENDPLRSSLLHEASMWYARATRAAPSTSLQLQSLECLATVAEAQGNMQEAPALWQRGYALMNEKSIH